MYRLLCALLLSFSMLFSNTWLSIVNYFDMDGTTLSDIFFNNEEIRKIVYNGEPIYSKGSKVTYHIDNSIQYIKDIPDNTNVLSNIDFSTEKDGWSFVGWREDTQASTSTISSKLATTPFIDLYAVYKTNYAFTIDYQTIGSAPSSSNYQAVYNNGNISNPKILLPTYRGVVPGHSFQGWTVNGVLYGNGKYVTIDSDTTAYGTFNCNGTTYQINDFTSYPLTQVGKTGNSSFSTTSNCYTCKGVLGTGDQNQVRYVIAETSSIYYQGCNKIRISYTSNANGTNTSTYINDVSVSGTGTLVLDMPNTTFTIKMQASTNYGTAELKITKIELFCEH